MISKMKLINGIVLCIVCGSVYATQNEIDKNVINEIKLSSSDIQLNMLHGKHIPYAFKDKNDDVIIVPMGQCEPMPFCQQLER
ncbi:hypothetical protein [Shewanella sp.]|uniref:hypothetical protein n=1 Tax=Shewanella sp. TaxID=50422 RepID=UPI00258DC594|nr:hypothetical protein [Shewanella sp.]MCJ8301597.1 hypothetical protein [Shewanella sp.]